VCVREKERICDVNILGKKYGEDITTTWL